MVNAEKEKTGETMTEAELLYWDVELKTSKWVTPITIYITFKGGAVTDIFCHDGSAIYLLRARMNTELAEEVKNQMGVKSVEIPPRLQGMTVRRIK
jgi:hypothetical protein